MPDTIRIGVVGAGANTRKHHIPNLKKIEGVEIVSVVNRSRASSERVAQEFGIPRVHDNWRNLVNDPGIDAVVIGTWPYMHCPVTLAALAAGAGRRRVHRRDPRARAGPANVVSRRRELHGLHRGGAHIEPRRAARLPALGLAHRSKRLLAAQ